MPTLSDLFKNRTIQLPYGAGSYQSPVPNNTAHTTPMFSAQVGLPAVPTTPQIAPVPPIPPIPEGGLSGGSMGGNSGANQETGVPSSMINPKTGQMYSPEELVSNTMASIPERAGTGDIPQYAGDAITRPDQSIQELNSRAYGLNNTRNDLSTGETDPYNVASKSGIAYNPAELRAIESAYAGIYDPALSDVFSKLEAKQKADEESRAFEREKEKMALQFGYDKALKGMTASAGGSSAGGGMGYTPGENTTVDYYVQRINNGEITEKDAMAQLTGVKNTDLRAAISNALAQTRTQNVKYTSALSDVSNINNLLANEQLSDVTGPLDQLKPQWATFGKEAEARALLSNLESNLQLAKSGSLQGQGAVSDYERSLVKNAATGLLARNLSAQAFKDALIQYRAGLLLINNESVPVIVTSPDGSELEGTLNREDIAEAIRDGARIKYI